MQNIFLLHDSTSAICIPTNGVVINQTLVMGAGMAKVARDTFVGIDSELGILVNKQGNIPFYLPQYHIFSFPTKHHWKSKSDIKLIENSACSINQFVEQTSLEGIQKIYVPKVGCGLGGLSWEVVKPILEKYLTNPKFILVE